MAAHPFPLFELRLVTPRLELHLPTDAELLALLESAQAGIHDPEASPFLHPWTDLPPTELGRSFLQYHWARRGAWRAADWSLGLAVFADGRPIGEQALRGVGFGVRRVVETGSWLTRAAQRQGLGTEMRTAALALAFDGLGAEMALSGYLEGNVASLRVSEKLGYVPNGESVAAPRGRPLREFRLRLERAAWERLSHAPVRIEGLEGCRDLFGV